MAGHSVGPCHACGFGGRLFLGRGMRVLGRVALRRPKEGAKTLKQTFHGARGGGGVLFGFHIVGR